MAKCSLTITGYSASPKWQCMVINCESTYNPREDHPKACFEQFYQLLGGVNPVGIIFTPQEVSASPFIGTPRDPYCISCAAMTGSFMNRDALIPLRTRGAIINRIFETRRSGAFPICQTVYQLYPISFGDDWFDSSAHIHEAGEMVNLFCVMH